MERLYKLQSGPREEVSAFGITSLRESFLIPSAAGSIAMETGFTGQKVHIAKGEGNGFETLYQTPALASAEVTAIECQLLDNMIASAMAANGWQASDVEAVAIGNGCATDGHFPEQIIARHGLVNVADNHSMSMLACNSGTHALLQALRKFEQKRTLYIGFDSPSRLLNSDGRQSDDLSKATFSTGGAVIAFVPGVDLQILELAACENSSDPGFDSQIIDGIVSFADEQGVLAAEAPYKHMLDSNGDMVQVQNGKTMVRIPEPPAGYGINMNGFGTTKFFIRKVPQVLIRAYQMYVTQYGQPDSSIPVVSHHPSPGPYTAILERLHKNLGENAVHVPWVVTEGNVSGGTSTIAMARLLGSGAISRNQIAMFAGYGAGGTASAFFARVN